MATNTAGEPVDVPVEDGENRADDARVCECGDHADIVDGLCRRCGLAAGTPTEPAPEPAVEAEPEPVAEETPA